MRNFRLTPDFVVANWKHVFNASFFSSAYVYTFQLALVTAVVAHGLMPEAYAARLGRTARDDIRATGRHFKWQLALLARHFGLAA